MVILKIIRAILRALGLWKPAVDNSNKRTEASHESEISCGLSGGQSIGQSTEVEVAYYPYRRRDDFLSPAERNFFRVLYQVVGEKALICVKVNLADLFFVSSRDTGERRVYTNKIDRKHVDFVLCDPQSLTPILGIELDDRSHDRAERQQRDHFVENVFAEAGLPLLRVRVQRSYVIQELEKMLDSYLQSVSPMNTLEEATREMTTMPAGEDVAQTDISPNSEAEQLSPRCPKCGSEMALRLARGGVYAGQYFWGCKNYPRCKTMMAYGGVVAGVVH